MITASLKGENGQQDLLIVGLSFGNLDKFRVAPGDTYIKIDGRELGLTSDVLLFSEATEADCAEMIKSLVGPITNTTVSDRLKN